MNISALTYLLLVPYNNHHHHCLLLLQAVDDSVHCSVVVVSHTSATNTLNLDASNGPSITLPILPEFPAGVREEDSMCVTFASDASHI